MVSFINNVVNAGRTGVNFNAMFETWDIRNGIRSGLIKALSHEFKYTQIFNFLVNKSSNLSTFDWNATDEEIRKQYKQLNEEIASNWGQVFGRAIGSSVSIALGSGSSLILPKISGARLADQIIKSASSQAREDLIDEIQQALNVTTRNTTSYLALEGFIQYRSLLKKMPESLLATIYGEETAKWIKTGWGNKNGPSLRISDKIEEKIESIKNEVIQEFVREAIDGFTDSFIDTGFVIAQEFDDALRQYQLNNRINRDNSQIIEIYPDADSEERYLIQQGSQEEIENITEQIINNHRILQNRDVGQIIASSIDTYRSTPLLRKLEIIFKSKNKPPYYLSDGSRCLEKIISIPNVKKNLTWQHIKSTFGNNRIAFTAGNNWCVLKFKNTRRYLKVQLDDVNNAESLLKEWATLSELEYEPPIRTNNYQDLPAQYRTQPTPMYAVQGRLIHTNIEPSGRISRQPPSIFKFDLWRDDPPDNFDDFFNNPQR